LEAAGMHGNVGGLMVELGRLSEAGVHLLYAKKIMEEMYGEESRELESIYTDLKRLYRLQNRQDEVLRYTRKLTRMSALY
jgi:hypothetical protein